MQVRRPTTQIFRRPCLEAPAFPALINRGWYKNMQQQHDQRKTYQSWKPEQSRPAFTALPPRVSAAVIRRASLNHYFLEVYVNVEQNSFARAVLRQSVR